MRTTTKYSKVNTDRKRNCRTHALEPDILDDHSGHRLNSKQRRLLARVAHAREQRLGTIASARKSGMLVYKNRKLDNRNFRVCENAISGTGSAHYRDSMPHAYSNSVWSETTNDRYVGYSIPSSTCIRPPSQLITVDETGKIYEHTLPRHKDLDTMPERIDALGRISGGKTFSVVKKSVYGSILRGGEHMADTLKSSSH